MKKRLAVIGNGMAAGRLLDELTRRNAGLTYDVTVYGEERHAAYNRILLGRVLGGEGVDAITLKDPAWYSATASASEPGVRVRQVNAVGRTLTTCDGRTLPYDAAVFATGSAAVVPPVAGMTARRRLAEARGVRLPHRHRLCGDPRLRPAGQPPRSSSARGSWVSKPRSRCAIWGCTSRCCTTGRR